jgi:tungstate transport system ATP-binding protein
VSLKVREGQRSVVLGANGAGKSVLLRTLHGLIGPDEGVILWAGKDTRPREQAMVFQRPVMLRRGALANIEYALAVNGHSGPAKRERAREAIERVGLAHLAKRQARVLSGGEQQRLALARAWALRPRLLFLDEPTASLDPAAAADVERIVGEIHAAGTTIVMTTHVLGLARRTADEILFLHEGRLVESAPADRFFTAPASVEAARFLQGELPWNTVPP